MRVPMNIDGTDYVYLATWAVLTAIHRHNRNAETKIETLVCPAFGTGSGGVAAVEAGIQMRVAHEHFARPPAHINPSMAQARHDRVHYGGRWGFHNPRKL